MSDSIPTINIVDEENYELTIADVSTDVEELEGAQQQSSKQSKTKLKIKLNNDLGTDTDSEHFEGSDLDEPPTLIVHKKRMSNFNIDAGIIEETCKVNDKIGKTNLKLHSQKSQTQEYVKKLSVKNELSDLTDTENVSGTDTESSSDVPEIQLDSAMYECMDSVNTKDNMKYSLVATPSPCITPAHCLSEEECTPKQKKGIRLSVSMSQISNVTDIELLESDVETNESTIRRIKRTKRRRVKSKPESKENELDANSFLDAYSSKYKSEEFLSPKYHSGSKDKYNKNDGGTTEIEDFEADFNVATEYLYDSSAMDKEIEKMQYFYGPTKEKHLCKRRKEKMTKSESQLTDESDENIEDRVKPKSIRRHNKHNLESKRYMQLPKIEGTCLTDLEDMLSSDTDNLPESSRKPPLHISGNLTEEEILLESSDYLGKLTEIKLPNAKREIMIIKENDASTPTVVVAPLNEDETPLGLNITPEEFTDAEDISIDEITDDENNEDVIENDPQEQLGLEEIGNEQVEERECVKTSKRSLHVPSERVDYATDTEEVTINVDSENRRKPKLITLTIEELEKTELTDTEDICFSDAEHISQKSSAININECSEQTEDSEDDKYVHPTQDSRKVVKGNVPRPTSDSESTDTSCSPKTIHTKLKKAVSAKIDLNGTDDVMYLKGGSYYGTGMDGEYIAVDLHSNTPKGWSAPDGESKDKPTAAVAKQGAVMQGEAYGSQEKPEQTTPQTFSRAESDESTGQRQSTDPDRPIVDQHMLSDEMKRLLKELEEESKK